MLSINSGANNSNQNFEFGNINSIQNTRQIYTSIDYKWHVLEGTNLQFGVSHNYHRNTFKDSIPTYYYALSPSSPNYFSDSSIYNNSSDRVNFKKTGLLLKSFTPCCNFVFPQIKKQHEQR